MFFLSIVGWILVAVGSICFTFIFQSKIAMSLIDELNKNLYCDVADKFQEVFDDTELRLVYGIFTKRERLKWEAIKRLLKLSIPPEQTKLRCYQRFLKVLLFLPVLGLAMFFTPFILLEFFL